MYFYFILDSAPIHRPGLGAQISHYAPPMRNEHSIQEEMGVPGNLVGLIIGRGGENLKRIERETGCRVQVSQGTAKVFLLLHLYKSSMRKNVMDQSC